MIVKPHFYFNTLFFKAKSTFHRFNSASGYIDPANSTFVFRIPNKTGCSVQDKDVISGDISCSLSFGMEAGLKDEFCFVVGSNFTPRLLL